VTASWNFGVLGRVQAPQCKPLTLALAPASGRRAVAGLGSPALIGNRFDAETQARLAEP
jgi:hypothetical protein